MRLLGIAAIGWPSTITRPGATALEGAMTRADCVLAAYGWAIGDCFKCAKDGALTTQIGKITAPNGDRYVVRACEACVVAMEEERRRWAERRGHGYQPGSIGMV